MPDDLNELEQGFTEDMRRIYTEAWKQCRYLATRFRQMVDEMGGRATAKELLHGPPQEGLATLILCGCSRLTMEALIVRNPRYHCLFTEEELQEARRRLGE